MGPSFWGRGFKGKRNSFQSGGKRHPRELHDITALLAWGQPTLREKPFAFTRLSFQMPQRPKWGQSEAINSPVPKALPTIPNKLCKNSFLLCKHNFRTCPQAMLSTLTMTSKILLFRACRESMFVQHQVRGWVCPPLKAFPVFMVSA